MTAPTFLELFDVLEIHDDLLASLGGNPGVRDTSLLQSAMAIPMAGSGETLFHADLYEMAAACVFAFFWPANRIREPAKNDANMQH